MCRCGNYHVVRAIVVFLSLSLAAAAHAAPSAPKLKAKALSGAVRLNVEISRKYAVASSILDVQRRSCSGGSYTLAVQLQGPKSRQTVIDTPPQSGRWCYRTRIQTKRGRSKWSKSANASVTVVPPAPTPAPTPTAVPEPLPTPPPTALLSGQSDCPTSVTDRMLELINLQRANNSVAPLAIHPQLQWSSRTHAIMIAEQGVLSHDGWDALITQSGFSGSLIGENIALGVPLAEAVVNAWMAHSGHRENILRGSFQSLGIGCVIDSGYAWWVADFGGS